MKKLLLLLFICLFSFKNYAQDPQLFENDWYLQKIVEDGVDYYPPIIGFIGRLNFTPETFGIWHVNCDEGFYTLIDYTSQTTFNINDTSVIIIGTCGDPDVNIFMGKHYTIYLLENNYAKNPFTYEFTSYNDHILLTVVNVDGDYAIYGDELLFVQDNLRPIIAIYPNPVQDILTIDNNSYTEITSIKIYDVLGRLVISDIGNIDQLDVSHLDSGLLFVEIETDQGVVTKKIIKN